MKRSVIECGQNQRPGVSGTNVILEICFSIYNFTEKQQQQQQKVINN